MLDIGSSFNNWQKYANYRNTQKKSKISIKQECVAGTAATSPTKTPTRLNRSNRKLVVTSVPVNSMKTRKGV